MALTRSGFRHLAYLLEVAPITHGPERSSRYASYRLESRPKRRNVGAQPIHTSAAYHKLRATQTKKPLKKGSAAGVLVSDAEIARKPAATFIAQADVQGTPQQPNLSAADIALDRLTQVLSDAKRPLQIDRAVTEKEALTSLKLCYDLAKGFKDIRPHEKTTIDSPALELLFADNSDGLQADQQTRLEQAASIKGTAIKKIAATARAIIIDPKVFITPAILKSYVDFRAFIGHPEDLAEVFRLYATKLVPEPKSSPVKYTTPASDRAPFAIPAQTAQEALTAAIDNRNLPLCLDIVSDSVTKTAFKRHKLIQKALLPFTAVGMAPVAAYALASQFAVFQENLNTDTARWVGFAGIMSYVAFTGTIGLVAVTTANDQMERVVWQDGTPLRERWLREEERRMLDQIAVAWGFKDPYRKGEEEGPEWEALREYINLRGMVLDKIELMEGMQ